MKHNTMLAMFCAAAIAPSAAIGGTFQDFDNFFVGATGVGTLVNSSTPLSSQFNYLTGGDPSDVSLASPFNDQLGYNPATETVTGFELSIQLTTAATGLQTVFVNINGVIIPTSFAGAITFGGTIAPNIATAILAEAQDGVLPYTFTAPAGSSYNVNYAFMKITTTSKPGGVPDAGSTMAMLGLALGGLGMVRRRLS